MYRTVPNSYETGWWWRVLTFDIVSAMIKSGFLKMKTLSTVFTFSFLFAWMGLVSHREYIFKRRYPKIFSEGTVSRDGYFLRSKHFNQYFLCMCWWFWRSFNSFSLLPYTIIYFLFASLKLLTNFENAYCTKTLLRIPFSVIGRTFTGTDLSLAAGKMRKN